MNKLTQHIFKFERIRLGNKTTTQNTLSKNLCLTVQPWINPEVTRGKEINPLRQAKNT